MVVGLWAISLKLGEPGRWKEERTVLEPSQGPNGLLDKTQK